MSVGTRTAMIVGGMLLAVFGVFPLLSRMVWGGFATIGLVLFWALVLWAVVALVRGLRVTTRRRQISTKVNLNWRLANNDRPTPQPVASERRDTGYRR